jgi:replicative DNA helicase
MNEKRDYSTILFTPEQIGNLGAEYLKRRQDHKNLGVPIYNKTLDADFYPLNPGELCSIIARPGNGKTGFMMRWARERSSALRQANIKADERISITQLAKGEITKDEWKVCLKNAINRRFLPLWNIGYSSMTTAKQIRVDIDAMTGAITLIRDEHKLTPDIIFVDYLQRIPVPGNSESKTIAVSENVDALKTLALQYRCPVVVGVQARREVEEKNEPIPEIQDGQWTSNIEQTSDRVIALVRPRLYREEGKQFGKRTVNGHYQMLVAVLKQKLGRANYCEWVYFEPEFNKLDLLEREASATTIRTPYGDKD